MKKSVRRFAAISVVLCLFLCPAVLSAAEGAVYTSLYSAQVGDTVLFGRFEQESWDRPADTQNPIEWIVMALDGSKAYLLAKHAVAVHTYHNVMETNVVWADAQLNEWLNSTFFYRAFNRREQEIMVQTTVEGENSPFYPRTAAGRATKAYVWLLSVSEWEKYVKGTDYNVCSLTPDAWKALHLDTTEQFTRGQNECWWWLRNPCYDNSEAQFVSFDGHVTERGHMRVTAQHGGVRPVICVDLSKY